MFFHNYIVQKLVILNTAKVCESQRTDELVNLWFWMKGCKLRAEYLTKSSSFFRIFIIRDKILKRQN
jgi:hypothetical protein